MKQKHALTLLGLVFAMGLVGCGSKVDSIPVSEPIDDKAFSGITEFDEPVDQRTQEQINLMEYDGDYGELTNDYLAVLSGNEGGTKNVGPKGFDIEWEHEPDEGLTRYELEVSKERSMEDSYTFKGNKQKKITVRNLEVGETYYYRVRAVYDDDSSESSGIHTLETADVLPRNIEVDGITNCRDLGGKVTLNGGKIKQGMIYRTGALDDANQSGCLVTDKGRDTMLNQLHIRSEIDLRGGANGSTYEGSASNRNISQLNNDGVKYNYIPFAYEGGRDNLFRNLIPFRKFFECFENPEECYPTFFHCRIGTDRTGMCAVLLNGLLGLDLQSIYQDYVFSNFGKIGKNCSVNQNNRDNVATYVAVLQTYPGETFQDKCFNFLVTIGVKPSILQSIVDNCIEGEKPTFVADKISVNGPEKLTASGGATSQSKTAFRSPSKVITLKGKGQKLSFTFNAAEATNASITAMMMSHNVSATLDSALTVTLDENALPVKTTSFATTDLGFASSGDYWEPARLVDSASLSKGSHTLTIEARIADEMQFENLVLGTDKANAIS